MPYITKDRRKNYEPFIEAIILDVVAGEYPVSEVVTLASILEVAGDYNYVVSSIIWRLFNKNKRYSTGDTLVGALEQARFCIDFEYQDKDPLVNVIVNLGDAFSQRETRGTLACVALEFYRRKLAVYEDEAIQKNGDIE